MIEEYNDTSVLTQGKYRYVPLREVPAEYLLTLYKNGGNGNKALLKYVTDNYEAIQARVGVTIDRHPPTCAKISYVDKKAANAHIKWIQSTNKESCVPVRAYQCDKCTSWHITSTE